MRGGGRRRYLNLKRPPSGFQYTMGVPAPALVRESRSSSFTSPVIGVPSAPVGPLRLASAWPPPGLRLASPPPPPWRRPTGPWGGAGSRPASPLPPVAFVLSQTESLERLFLLTCPRSRRQLASSGAGAALASSGPERARRSIRSTSASTSAPGALRRACLRLPAASLRRRGPSTCGWQSSCLLRTGTSGSTAAATPAPNRAGRGSADSSSTGQACDRRKPTSWHPCL